MTKPGLGANPYRAGLPVGETAPKIPTLKLRLSGTILRGSSRVLLGPASAALGPAMQGCTVDR